MMKGFAIVAAAIIILAVSAFTIFNKPKLPQTASPNPTAIIQEKEVNITATFTIITGNITRSFKAEKYHRKSPDVYIENPNPAIVHVKKLELPGMISLKPYP